MRRVNVKIQRSERESVQIQVGAWEVDVVRFVFGPQNVEVGEVVETKGEYPDPTAEFERLSQRYGADRENGGAPFVAQVYGGMGAARLAELIERERAIGVGELEERAAEPAPAPAPVASKPVKRVVRPGTPGKPASREVSDIAE